MTKFVVYIATTATGEITSTITLPTFALAQTLVLLLNSKLSHDEHADFFGKEV